VYTKDAVLGEGQEGIVTEVKEDCLGVCEEGKWAEVML
jgi:hypothetical protein